MSDDDAGDHVNIKWTRAEAMACAYCWAEFSKLEKQPGSPETYWQECSERTRQECRKIVRDRHLLAVAFRQAAPVFPASDDRSRAKADEIGAALGLKAGYRIYAVIQAVHRVFLPSRLKISEILDVK